MERGEESLSPLEPVNYDSPQALRSLLDERNLGMRKKYGQNFLINRDARNFLLDALEIPFGASVWEIGPGVGAMTYSLLERGARVTAFEIDRGFIALLEEFFGKHPDFTLIPGDALRTWKQVSGGDYFFGNLPYNIASTLLGNLVEENRFFKRIVVTVQREVAQRMIAKPGSRDYSSFSALLASAYSIRPLRVIRGSSFYPAPNIDSQGVRLDLLTDRDPADYPPCFKPLLRALFSSRRKTIKNNLLVFIDSLRRESPFAGESEALALEVLGSSGISPQERAEKLGLEEFVRLAENLEARIIGSVRKEGSP